MPLFASTDLQAAIELRFLPEIRYMVLLSNSNAGSCSMSGTGGESGSC